MINAIHAGFVTGHGMVEKWTKKNVLDWITACRTQGGLPLFMARFAGAEWKYDNEPAVRAVCYAGEGPEITTYFYDVPKEDEEMIEEKTEDWVHIVEKYEPNKLKELMKYPIVLKGGKLPRIVVKG